MAHIGCGACAHELIEGGGCSTAGSGDVLLQLEAAINVHNIIILPKHSVLAAAASRPKLSEHISSRNGTERQIYERYLGPRNHVGYDACPNSCRDAPYHHPETVCGVLIVN